MHVVGLLVTTAAAFRLRSTPLALVAAVLLGVHGLVTAWHIVLDIRQRPSPTLLTAAQHTSMALGAFFLFVSFAVR